VFLTRVSLRSRVRALTALCVADWNADGRPDLIAAAAELVCSASISKEGMMFSAWRMVLQAGVVVFLTASVLLAQAARPASEATEFFKKYDPTHQLVDAVRKVGVAGKGGGGGGGSPADRKHCDGQLTATPKQADQLMRRLFAGARETAEKA